MASKCGAYQAPIAATERHRPSASCRRMTSSASSTAATTKNAIAKCGSVQAPTTPPTQNATIAHVVFERSSFECRNDDDAHGEKGEPVAARLSRDVEEQRRRRCEEEKEQSAERAMPNVQPDRDDATPAMNGTAAPSRKSDLGLADERARRPAEQAEELVVVRRVGAGQDLAGPCCGSSRRRS